MSHPTQSLPIYRFGAFQADLDSRELWKNGVRIRLQEKPFQLLAELLRHPGQVISREELRRRLWPADTFVDFDEGVNTAVKRLRLCLGDSPDNPVYIETVPRYGYRFIAPVNAVEAHREPSPGSETTSDTTLAKPVIKDPSGHVGTEKAFWGRPLPRLSLALVVAVAMLLGIWGIYGNWKHSRDATWSPLEAIAVLPLENLSGDPAQEYFADGITEEIITDLAKLPGPRVISRTSTMQYKGRHKTIPEITRELKVDGIVEGSVERSGEHVRVRVQLIRASTDQHMWAEAYDRELSDVLGLEAEVAQDIARHVQTQFTPQQQQVLAPKRALNPQAFQDYLLGRHYWAMRTKQSLTQAVEYFNRAIQEDPGDARSYAGLAHCYIVMPMLTGTPLAQALEKARQAASKALALDDSLPEGHLAVAETLLYHDWNFADAEKEFLRTLQLNPNYSTGHQWYAEFLGLMGRHDEAIREVRQALVLDPLSAIVHHQAANILRNAGRNDEAISEYKEALKISPSFYISYGEMSLAFWREGKTSEAIQAQQKCVAGYIDDWGEDPAIARAIDDLPRAYASAGRPGYIRQVMKIHSYLTRGHFYIGRDYAELGDRDAAIAELKRSFQAHEMELLWSLTDPDLDPLRPDPRFERLIRAIGFPH